MSPRSIPCPRCEGTGGWPDARGITRGGTLYIEHGLQTCPTCRGTGQASLFEPMGDGARKGFGHVNAGSAG